MEWCQPFFRTLGIILLFINIVSTGILDNHDNTSSRNVLNYSISQKDDVPEQIKKTIDIIKKGSNELKNKTLKDVVLVVGNTGAGKSTAVIWLTNDDKLSSKKLSRGEYLIEDTYEHARIGNSTVRSATIYPELYIDEETKTGYYDTPGFDDTRSTSNDIATTFLLNNVIASSRSLKIIFVVNYHSVRQGVEREDFLKLIKHSTELVANLDRYKDSIFLIVTKVDNLFVFQEENYNLIDDTTITNGIADFLREVRQDLEMKILANPLDKEFNKKAVQFIDILLLREGEIYKKIGLFRRPMMSGCLCNMSRFIKEKQYIKHAVQHNLVFTKTQLSDFGHTISEKSKNDINDFIQVLLQNIFKSLAATAKIMSKHFKTYTNSLQNKISNFKIKANESTDIELNNLEDAIHRLSNDYNTIKTLVKKINDTQSIREIQTQLFNTTDSLRLTIPDNDIMIQNDLILFLEEATNKKFITNLKLRWWHSPFVTILTEIIEPKNNFFNSLQNIKNKIENMVRKNIESIVQEIKNDFEKQEVQVYDLEKTQELFANNYRKLSEIENKSNKLEANYFMKQMTLTDPDMNINFPKYIATNINQNISYYNYLKSKVDTIAIKYLDDSQKWYTFVKKLYEKLSMYDMQKNKENCNTLSYGIIPEKPLASSKLEKFLEACYKKQYKEEYDIVKHIVLDSFKFLALEKVLSATLRTTYSQKCEFNGKMVIKGHFIKLSDVDISFCNGTIKSLEIFALNKIFIDSNFQHKGKIDLSIIAPIWDIQGDHDINLYGASGEVHKQNVNVKELTGQPGQPGGPGGNFLGVADKVYNGQRLKISTIGGKGGPGQDGGQGARGQDGTSAPEISISPVQLSTLPLPFELFYASNPSETLISEGKLCTEGGQGGDAGAGGMGGNAGILQMISFSNVTNVKMYKNTGRSGQDGVAGKGGPPGKPKTWQTKEKVCTPSFLFLKFCKLSYTQNGQKECNSGYTGEGINTFNMQNHELPIFSTKSQIINDYKMYSRENLRFVVMKSQLISFLDNIDNNTSILEMYDLKAFYDELIGLETLYYNSWERTYFSSLYRSLLTRIDQRFEVNLATSGRDIQNKQVINYLRVACMTKIASKQNNLEKVFVVDTTAFFELISEHIKRCQKTLKEVKLDNSKQQYQKEIIDELITAKNLIEQSILPDVEAIYKEIDDEIQLLIQDLWQKINEAEREKEKIAQLKEQFSESFVSKSMLRYINIFINLLNFLRPDGALQHIANGIGVLFDETKIFDCDKEPSYNIQQEQGCLRSNFMFLPKVVNKDSVEILYHITNPLLTLINQNVVDEKYDIDELDDAAQNAAIKINQLKEFEKIIVSLKYDLEEKLKGLQSTKVHVELDGYVFAIQNTTKVFRVNVEYLVDASAVSNTKSKLLDCIDRVEIGLLTMIKIYSRIQDYHEKTKLVTYIADVNSNSIIEDSEYNVYINKLEYITKNNILLQEFHKATFSFKQFIFPFANMYLDQFHLAPNLESNNIKDLVSTAITKIEYLRDQLTIDASVIRDNAYRIFPDISFEITNRIVAPFIVWKHEDYKYDIINLLEGKEVTIKAEIDDGIEANAVKFREIGIRFFMSNKTLQTELDGYLSEYLVQLTHLGESFYRCDNSIVAIPHSVITMTHSANKENGHYYHLDKVSTQIKNNPPMCSPYATWKIKLLNKKRDDFSNLKQFKDQTIDLLLEGWGQYIDLGLDVCGKDLNRFYKIVSTIDKY